MGLHILAQKLRKVPALALAFARLKPILAPSPLRALGVLTWNIVVWASRG